MLNLFIKWVFCKTVNSSLRHSLHFSCTVWEKLTCLLRNTFVITFIYSLKHSWLCWQLQPQVAEVQQNYSADAIVCTQQRKVVHTARYRFGWVRRQQGWFEGWNQQWMEIIWEAERKEWEQKGMREKEDEKQISNLVAVRERIFFVCSFGGWMDGWMIYLQWCKEENSNCLHRKRGYKKDFEYLSIDAWM